MLTLKWIARRAAWIAGLFGMGVSSAHAVDSYRWLHVTIDTPWAIFLFLLPMVLVPVVLMAILYWRFAIQKPAKKGSQPEGEEPQE